MLLVAIVVYSAAGGFAKGSTFGSVLAVGFIAAAASLIVGTLLGFLFGLPRTREQAESTALLATNTNLDQISDWLTKILVGLGLVQLGKLTHGINSLASSLAPGLGGETGGPVGAHAFAIGLLVYSIADGFLLGYLWTRIIVSGRLKVAAENLASAEVRQSAQVADLVLSKPLPAAPPLPPPPPGGAGATASEQPATPPADGAEEARDSAGGAPGGEPPQASAADGADGPPDSPGPSDQVPPRPNG